MASKFLLGVDEAGRGPLAGPVAVGVVAVAEDFDLLAAFPGLNDSKKLSEKNRERLFAILEEQSMWDLRNPTLGQIRFAVEMSSAAMIDQNGIRYAVSAALTRGVRSLAPVSRPRLDTVKVLLDGSLAAPSEYEQETVIGGDALVPAIMLASVAAKVVRDRLVVELAKQYPQYGFEKHKGYGTAAHYAALKKYGLCAIHRRTFVHLDSRDTKGYHHI